MTSQMTACQTAQAPGVREVHRPARGVDRRNAARVFETDDVIDPAETGGATATALAGTGPVPGSGPVVDTW